MRRANRVCGINFLVPCGTTGESPTLTRKEHLRVIEITLEEAKGKGSGCRRSWWLQHSRGHRTGAGTSSNGRRRDPVCHAVLQQAHAGRLVSTLQSDRRHAIPVPIIVYSVQGRTGVNVEPATLKRLSAIGNIVGVKEASGNVSQMARVVHEMPPAFDVLCGDDSLTISLTALGGCGVISVLSNELPAEMAKLTQLALAGDFAGARAMQRRLFDLMETNFVEANPIPVKTAMAMMGLLEPVWRLPMCPPSDASKSKIEAVLKSGSWLHAARGTHAD